MNMKRILLAVLAAPMCAGAYDLHSKLFVPIKEKTPPAGGEMAFVTGGKPDFAIVIDKDAEKRAKNNKAAKSIGPAVKILKREFGKVFGAKVEVVDENDAAALAKHAYQLVVGDSRTARENGVDVRKLPDQGFSVKTFAKGIIVAGSDSSLVDGYNGLTRLDKRGSSLGTKYGAIDFVNRFLGVIYLFPGEYGTYRPQTKDLVIKPVHYEDAPYFNHHSGTYFFGLTLSPKKRPHWEKLMGKIAEEDRAYVYWRLGGTNPIGGGHCPEPISYGKLHPDKLKTIFYTSPNGKFWHSPVSYMANYYNVVDLGFADLLIEDWKRIIESDGAFNLGGRRPISGRKSLQFGVCDVTMTPPDMLGDPTVEKLGLMTEKDLALGSDRAFSNVYGRFHQYLAKRVKELWPDAKLWLMPYYNCYYAATDPKWKLPDNVEINFCARDFPLYMRDAKRMEKTIEMLHDWYVALGNRPAQRLWLYNSRHNLAARAIAPEFIADVPKICGKYLGREGGLFYDWDGVNDLWNHYYAAYAGVMSQWNPDFDVDGAIDAHWNLFYGPKAGPHLCRFHRILKDCYLKHFLHSKDAYPQYPIEQIDAMEKCLKDAEAALAPGSVEMKRLRVLAEPWAAEFEKRRILAAYVPQIYEAKKIAKGTVKDAAFWADLKSLKLFDPKNMNVLPERPTEVKLAWDEENLYLHLDARHAPKADVGLQLWGNDTLEMFVCPGLGKEVKYMIATDPNGDEWTQFDRMLPVPQPSDRTWRPKDLKITASKSADAWRCDIVLPFKGMECTVPTPGTDWNLNVVRTAKKTKPAEVVSCSLTMGDHHNAVMYGILRFCE